MAWVPKSWLGEVREERKDIHTDTPTMELASAWILLTSATWNLGMFVWYSTEGGLKRDL